MALLNMMKVVFVFFFFVDLSRVYVKNKLWLKKSQKLLSHNSFFFFFISNMSTSSRPCRTWAVNEVRIKCEEFKYVYTDTSQFLLFSTNPDETFYTNGSAKTSTHCVHISTHPSICGPSKFCAVVLLPCVNENDSVLKFKNLFKEERFQSQLQAFTTAGGVKLDSICDFERFLFELEIAVLCAPTETSNSMIELSKNAIDEKESLLPSNTPSSSNDGIFGSPW
jgi:hypothetical protein